MMSVSPAAPTTNEIQISSHRVGYERLMKAVVAIVVLLLCIVLLRAIFQGVDSVLARRTERETQRRALLVEITRTPDPTDGLFPVANLSPMLRNPDSRQDVLPLARLVLPRITNFDAFQQLFTVVFPNPSVKDLAAIIDINVRVDYRRAIAQNTQEWVGYTASKPVGPGKKLTAPQPENTTLSAEQFQLNKEVTYTANQITNILRSASPDEVKNVDFANVNFYRADASGAKFSRAVLSNALFVSVDVSGASFKDIDTFDGVIFDGTLWWRAKEISAPLLKVLKDKYYLYYPNAFYFGPGPDPTDYVTQLHRLCDAVSLDCSHPVIGSRPK